MEIEKIKGIVVPLLTPIDSQENIDEKKLRYIVNHVIEHGVHGILAFGSNSEFYMFTDDEMIDAAKIIIDETQGRVPIFFGVGHIRTKHAIQLAKRAGDLAVDGISILQPMFIKPTDEAIYNHFRKIAEAIPEKMVLIYNNPGRTGYSISLDIIERLAHDLANIVGIKDSSGDLTFLSELIRRNQDVDFRVMAGKDTIVFPALSVGAVGSVCSTANMYPELVCGIYDKYVAGDLKGALENQFILNPIRLSQDPASFPAATKDMANLMGMDVGPSVLPTEETQGPILEKMIKEMTKAGFLP
ncbi:4-hydroxy-tetrahydrodipicolinate synthase [Enterococcus sp. PF1-24]|uniref:dihydrodipicolinate synthase family protein n=1 Tax=unclassified Enterococcus TaxID=2608891 RepID=UPI0024752ED2|nr:MULTISPECIES: dihydrodipicolinate synthase family protein [unclassified Enterococcus]MDH6364109.1 4-hydroxy-tetrahydrodipicolinate synthase [Enterococcus sp. PFB1-1]MDH6401210.1 4-hydroxy-tetrahydrodipicolinate synthase [Enterococcus sp. PF1-24]